MLGDTVVLKRVLIPCVGLMRVKCEGSDEKKTAPKCRPSELPFYCERNSNTSDIQDTLTTVDNPIESEFEKRTSQVRKEVFNSVQLVTDYVHSVTDKVNLDQAREWTAYLQEEENLAPRAGAIALGGLTGLIFGLRGGMIRKAFYTTAGTLTMTAVCYPKTSAQYTHLVIDDSKRYLTIAYNFVYGVKPGDPQKELPTLPSIPTSISEAWSLTSSIGRSAKTLILGETKEESSNTPPKVIITNLENIVENSSKNASCTKCDNLSSTSSSSILQDTNKLSSCSESSSSCSSASVCSNKNVLHPERGDKVKSKDIKNDIKSKSGETAAVKE